MDFRTKGVQFETCMQLANESSGSQALSRHINDATLPEQSFPKTFSRSAHPRLAQDKRMCSSRISIAHKTLLPATQKVHLIIPGRTTRTAVVGSQSGTRFPKEPHTIQSP